MNNSSSFLFVNGTTGNVGIGSLAPGVKLDVNGTVRSISGGYMFPDGSIQTSAASGGNSWSMSSGNVYTTTPTNNVGIGTSTPQGGFVVTNGNVGIGTWVPSSPLTIGANAISMETNGTINTWTVAAHCATLGGNSNAISSCNGYSSAGFQVDQNGNLGIGTTITSNAALSVMNGNVGIGTWVPSAALDIKSGNIKMVGNITIGNGSFLFSGASSFQGGSLLAKLSQSDGTHTAGVMTLGYSSPGIMNVGINTVVPGGALEVEGGNVGIGSNVPGQALDVTGTVRVTGFTMSGQGPSSGYVLTSSDSSGDAVWSPSSSVGSNYWLSNGGSNVGINTTQAVGIGTSFVGGSGEAAFSVMNGNVGIGTWVPGTLLTVGSGFSVGPTGNTNVHVLTASSSILLTATNNGIFDTSTVSGSNTVMSGGAAANSFLQFISTSKTGSGDYIDFEVGNVGLGTVDVMRMTNGNVGIGSLTPGTALDVTGTVRTVGFTMSGQTPSSGYVLTSSDSSGDAVWSPSSSVGSNYWLNNGGSNVGINTTQAVGIGTSFVGGTGEAALSIMNGNVGIGTWAPAVQFQIGSGNSSYRFGLTSGQLYLDDATANVSANGLIFNQSTTANIVNDNATAGSATAYKGGESTSSFSSLESTTAAGTSDYINFLTGSQLERMRIDTNGNIGIGTTITSNAGLSIMNGNVGIGTWLPGSMLDLKGGDLRFSSSSNNSSMFIHYTQGVTGDTSDLAFQASQANQGFEFVPRNGAGGQNNGLSIDRNGNVGIGTVIDSTGLTVMTGNVGIGTWVVDSGALILSNAMANFNVGIGTIRPGTALDVNGTIRSISGGFMFPDGSTQTSAASGGNSWSMSNGNVYTTTPTNNVGIGTSTPQGGLVVTNGNVGIGTWAPFGALEIKSSVATALTLDTYNSTGTAMSFTSSGSPTITLVSGTTKTSISSQDSYFSNGNVGIGTTVTTAGAALSVMNGNVGIGTWVPSATLNVIGTVTSTSNMNANGFIATSDVRTPAIQAGTSANNSLAIQSQSGQAGTTDSIKFQLNNGTTVGQWQDNSGVYNLGIGTTVPGAELDVEGTLYPTVFYGRGTDYNVGIGSMTPGTALDVNGVIRSTSGGFTFPDGSTQTSAASGGNSWSMSNGNVYTTTPTNNVGIGTSTPQGGFVVTNGNVGIGTWVPGYALEVHGGVYASGTVQANTSVITGATYGYSGTTARASTTIGTLAGGGAYPLLYNSGSAGYTGGYHAFNEGTSEVMRITTTGNVGIGSWGSNAANNSLSVVGNIGIGTNQSSAYIQTPAPNGGMIVEGNVGIGTILSGTTAGLSVMNGNVGIGTWVPGAPLTVWGGNGNQVTLSPSTGIFTSNGITGGTTAGGSLQVRSTSQNFGTTTGAITFFVHGGVEAMRIQDNSGIANIGIGTTVPGAELDVEGTLYPTVFYGRGTDYNVGIGSITPGTALDVNGVIRSTSGGFIFPDGSTQTSAASGGNSWSMSNGNVYTTTPTNNVGIGTSTPQGGLVITNGNVGIGTWEPASSLNIMGGNIGIGTSAVPQAITILGNNKIEFTGVSAQNQISTIGTDNSDNLNITSGFGSGKGVSINGILGVFAPTSINTLASAFQITDGSTSETTLTLKEIASQTADLLDFKNSAGAILDTVDVNGNVGIGSTAPGQALDVNGTVRATAFIGNGSQLTGINSSQWATQNTTDVSLAGGNVGIGTTITNAGAALSVMNGNVGIGTWAPSYPLQVVSTAVYPLVVSNGASTLFDITHFGEIDGSSIDTAGSGNQLTYTGYGGNGTLVQSNTITTGILLDLYQNASAFTGQGIGMNFGTGVGGSFAGDFLAFNNNSLTKFVVDSNGNVGIGTDAPLAGLAVMNGNVGIGTWVPGSTLSINGSIAVVTVSKSSDYTAAASDHVILVNASSGAVTITLPAAASSSGRMYQIKKTDSSANAMTIKGNASENIDGLNTVVTTSQYQSYTVVCDGTQWWII